METRQVGIRTKCDCGSVFTVPPAKRGDTIVCLDCNNSILALEPPVLERLKEERNVSMESHVLAISLWLFLAGCFLAGTGIHYMITRDLPISEKFLFGIGAQTGGLLFLLGGIGSMVLAHYFRRHFIWARTLFLSLAGVSLLLLFYFVGSGANEGFTSLYLIGFLLIVVSVFLGEDGKRVFRSRYRERMKIFRPSSFRFLKSYLFWLGLIVAAGVII